VIPDGIMASWHHERYPANSLQKISLYSWHVRAFE